MTAADRTNNMQLAMADRQAVFKGDCAVCHVKQGAGKYFKDLYDADCAICHEGPDRASMVPNLHTLKENTSPDFWRNWIAHGKPGSLMPAFSTAEGGPLDDLHISSLVRYLGTAMSPHPTLMQAPGGQHAAP
jgi:mono/diheme cytochrome c family protein